MYYNFCHVLSEKGVNVVERAEVLVDHGIERDIISIESVEEYLNIIFDTSYLKEEQRKILLNIALMQEDSIPMDLFEEVYLNNSSEQEVIDIFIYNINALAKKGWIQIEDDKVRLHSLVKNIVIKRFSDRGGFFESIIKYLKDKLYTDPTNNIFGNRKYIELAESLFGKIKEESEDLDNLKRGVASFLVHMGLFEKAKSIEGFGLKEGNFEAISKLHNLSIISSSQGNWQKSLSYSEKIFSLLGNTTVDMIYSDLMNELMLFFKVNRIENKSDFENKFTLENLICLIKIVFSASSNIILFKNEEKDFHKIIDQLHEIVSKKQNIIDILEKNIPKKDIISVELYKNLLLDQSAYLLNIGKCYFTLTELTKTEIYYLKALSIQERALESGHILLSQTYHKLTFLYIKWENIEKAEFFLEKNTELCSKLPPNNRFLSLCKSDAESIEKLKNTINVKRNTVLWLDLLNPNLSDSEIYRRMSSLYFEHEIYESAKEYLQKEIEIYLNQPDTDFRQVLDLNIKLGICYIQLKEFDNALTIEKEIFKLCQKEYVNKREMELQLSKFRYLITANALQCNYMPMAILIISQELKILANQFFSLFSTQPSKNYLLLSTEKIFAFLFNVPDLKYPFIEKTENELDSFLKEYDSVVSNATSELTESQYREFYKTKIHYIILNGYYYTIANLCMKYENWSLAIDYHRKKLLLSQKYFDETEHIGEIHYLLSCCYYNAGDFEIALQQLYKAIDLFSKICEKNNDEEIKTYLKNAFLFEKKIKGDLENFRKFPTKRSN
ncbi:tetratricopeptide repeat protein [Chryseobacterium sp. PS-8]|uniref:Tetratricopeptide repeat protein n=1 Tax=Chryseobacterium indicum TaxID=2766954 RepID=A0ABS9CB83_9FLAO|nr:tetratricopeptide repeat protein [Chryseobacterium sp. PS-8]MCF2221008.1 tetratricopeptide repeat protein [Chryseobacterium sp. PS-8]